MAETYDFGGYATRNDMLCSDGRVIRSGAFENQDGSRIPLVWQHQRDNIENVLGHADLEVRDDGVYANCKFNNTKKAQIAKALVEHRDLNSLSIFANKLMQKGRDVLHGEIKEVSLVLAGANPGAVIDSVYMEHSDGHMYEQEDEFILRSGEELEVNEEGLTNIIEKNVVEHSDSNNQNTGITEEHKELIRTMIKDELTHSEKTQEKENNDSMAKENEKTIKDIFDDMTEEQKECVYALIGLAVKEATSKDDDEEEDDESEMKHSDYYRGDDMPRNIFENHETDGGLETFTHSEMTEVLNDIPKYGTLRNSILQHGIENIDVFFPDAKAIEATPAMISREMGWVTDVLNGAKKTPFSRIKSTAVNMTADEARAKGYIKGKKKIDEQIEALKRVTTPQTVYKKQSLDRDDILDITDFDVVSFMKAELRIMLNEEIARSALIGDGRKVSDEDKIKPIHIRPIHTDDEVYTIHYEVKLPTSGDVTETSNAIVDAANFARVDYKGSGTPTFYADPKTITTLLMARDKIGNRMYRTMQDLAAAMRVSKIMEVPVMENITRETDDGTMNLLGIIVNISDYAFGADKGGNVSMFDDFDIDYNKEKYLIETRLSGALHRPKSAIVLESKATTTTTPTGGGAAG